MEIQMMRRAGYAMKIKTPAEAMGHPLATNGTSRRLLVCGVAGFHRRRPLSAQKNLSFHPAFAQVRVEIASV